MKKVLLIGCLGSGKTVFSKILSDKTGLPVVHLDKICHRDNWTKFSKEEADRLIQLELEKSEWILDGNFNRTIEHRLKYCDTVFYFELPVIVCIFSVIKRTIQNYGKVRDDVADNCIEKFDRRKIPFYKFIITFNLQHKKKYREMLENTKDVNVIIFKSRSEVKKYLNKM